MWFNAGRESFFCLILWDDREEDGEEDEVAVSILCRINSMGKALVSYSMNCMERAANRKSHGGSWFKITDQRGQGRIAR